ncbi:hypothetical protein ACYZTL_16450 [Pseudomonas sp. LB3P81]
MDVTPILRFRPVSASFTIGRVLDGPVSRTINMRLSLPFPSDVLTQDRRSLRDVHWSVQFVERLHISDKGKNEGFIGHVSYNAPYDDDDERIPESCSADVALDPDTFKTLLDRLSHKSLPSIIHLTTRGLTYGYDPDGWEKVWNIEEKPWIQVIEVAINLGLIDGPTAVDDAEPSDEPAYEPLAVEPPADRLATIMTDMQRGQAKVISRLTWLSGVVTLMLLYFYSRVL